MALPSLNSEIRFYLDGILVQAPVGWEDLTLLATFENDNVQANISIEQFDFILDAREKIQGRLDAGRFFEGIKFQIAAFNKNREVTLFEGYIDPTNELQVLPDAGKITASIAKKVGLNRLDEQLQGITYGFLFDEGDITEADFVEVDYVIDPINTTVESITLALTVAFLIDATIQQIYEVGDAVAKVAGILAAGITGSIGAAIYAAANLILQAAKLASLLLLVLDLGRRIFNALATPVRTHKGILLKTLLEKAFDRAGFSFETDIADLDNMVYLPSNLAVDRRGLFGKIARIGRIENGIPNSADYGYACTEIVELSRNLFNALIAVKDGTVQFRPKGSPYWKSQADYQVPDVLIERIEYNTEELAGDRLFSFDTDVTDDYTIDDYTGTAYEVITQLKGDVPKEANFVKGFEQNRFPICLGSRKGENSALDETLIFAAKVFDSIANTFGGRSNLAGSIKGRKGALRVSRNNHSKPKLLYVKGGRIPSNHRDKVSAKAFYDNYHEYDSFVTGEGQKVRNRAVRTGFGLEDFVKTIENGYLRNSAGAVIQAEKLEWRISADSATFDYFERKNYTDQLKEKFIEP